MGNQSCGSNLCDLDEEYDETEEKRFNERYQVKDDEVIGSGTFSTVQTFRDKADPEKMYAVKVVQTYNMGATYRLRNEIASLKLLAGHPGIVSLVDISQSLTSTKLVFELCEGGDLHARINQKRWYSERDAKVCCREVFKILSFVHSKNIMHRDLKPENILLVSQSSDTDIKLSDFGLCQISTSSATRPRSYETVGTMYYLAPELVNQQEYGQEVDVWAAGVITYCLLCGTLPFYDEAEEKVYQKILEQDISFQGRAWVQASVQAADFVRFVLEASAVDRPSADGVLAHAWLSACDPIVKQV